MPTKRAALLAFVFAVRCALSLACMAMQPTHPATTRLPPELTTTAITITATSTAAEETTIVVASTTTTITTCGMCTAVSYQVPDAATCGAVDAFYCTDNSLLSQTTDNCMPVTCSNGAKLVARNSAGAFVGVSGALTCASPATTPATYVDGASPPQSFPEATTVFCRAAMSCTCADPYTTTDATAQPAQTLVDTGTIGKYGCMLKNCGTYRLQYEDHSLTLPSITCNPIVPGYVDENGAPITKKVGCYDCMCLFDDAVQGPSFCRTGFFCPYFTKSIAKCGALCRAGETLLASTMGSPAEGVAAPASEVVCDGNNVWQPFGAQKLLATACAVPVDSLSTQIPADAHFSCTPLFAELAGGNFADIRYFSDQAGNVYATCLNGMITGAGVAAVDITAPMLYCDTAGWFALGSLSQIVQATCKTNACTAFLLNKGYTMAEVNMLKVSPETSGHCSVTCFTAGVNMKFMANGQPVEVATATVYNGLMTYIAADGTAQEIPLGSFMC